MLLEFRPSAHAAPVARGTRFGLRPKSCFVPGVLVASALVCAGCSQEAEAPTGASTAMFSDNDPVVLSPNGTAPTKLVDLSVTAVNSSQMRVSGRYVRLAGGGVAGMPVNIYAASTYFTRWATLYTDGNGYFNGTMSKVPSGSSVQVEVPGNGAYSRPLPTFARP